MKLLIQSILLTIVFTVITGILYPLAITGISQVAFHDRPTAACSCATARWSAPSCSRSNSRATNTSGRDLPRAVMPRVPSGASNLGPTSQALQSNVTANATAFRTGNKLAADARCRQTWFFTSASGLDPHISPEAARLQIARVAAARSMAVDQVKTLVEKFVEPPQWGIFGEARVNVLRLNLALDEMDIKKAEGTGAIKG